MKPRARAASPRALAARARRHLAALALPAIDVVRLSTAGAIVVLNNLETKNESNGSHGAWQAKQRRREAQRERVKETFRVLRARARAWPVAPPRKVHFVRLGRGTLDQFENLPMAFKTVKDQLCAEFGVDDGQRCPIAFTCDQRKRDVPGVEIHIDW